MKWPVLALLLCAVPAAAAEDQRAFAKCFSCHSVNPDETDLPGPNLHGIIGRPAAAIGGFRYSPAMRAAGDHGLVWTPELLDRYLQDPQAVVPETTMNLIGLRDAAERQRVIDYLRQQ